jgi:hypothetical protein
VPNRERYSGEPRANPKGARAPKHMRRSILHAASRREGGGRNTAIARQVGWRSRVSTERKDTPVKTRRGTEAFQAHESGSTSIATAGAAGAAGCPEHDALEQGRGNGKAGSPSDCPARSSINGSMSDLNRSESIPGVTRCEQPASAAAGAHMASTRSVRAARAGRDAGCLKAKDLVMTPGFGEHCPCGSEDSCHEDDQASKYHESYRIYT